MGNQVILPSVAGYGAVEAATVVFADYVLFYHYTEGRLSHIETVPKTVTEPLPEPNVIHFNDPPFEQNRPWFTDLEWAFVVGMLLVAVILCVALALTWPNLGDGLWG